MKRLIDTIQNIANTQAQKHCTMVECSMTRLVAITMSKHNCTYNEALTILHTRSNSNRAIMGQIVLTVTLVSTALLSVLA